MPDVRPGQPYTALLPQIVDSNGEPVTSGVTGTMQVYSPSDTTNVLTSGALAHQGNGFWGLPVAGSLLTTSGEYVCTCATVTYASTTLNNVQTAFAVGAILPWMRTLREVLVDLTGALEDGVASTTTTLGSTTTLIDTRWKQGLANELAGLEVYLLDPLSSADPNPLYVTASDPASGTITFTPAVSGAVPAGAGYLIGGRRYPHALKLTALRQVIRRVRATELASDQVTLLGAFFTFEYAIPAQFTSLVAVYWQPKITLYPTRWYELDPSQWRVRRDKRVLVVDPNTNLATPYARIRIDGRIAAPEPQFMTTAVPVPADWLVDAATAWLTERDHNPDDLREAGALMSDPRLRLVRPPRRSNEVWL